MTDLELLKLKQIEETLIDVWDKLTDKSRANEDLWHRFLNLQKRTKLLKMNLEKELKSENKFRSK